MSTLTIGRPPTQDAPPQEPRRRRWPRRLAVAIVALLVVGAAGAYFSVARYEPLKLVGGVWDPNSIPVSATPVSNGYVRIPYRENGRFAYGILLWNYGRFPVTIEDPGWIPQPQGTLSMLHTTEVDVFLSPNGGNVGVVSAALSPFHPVTIEPNMGVELVYRGRIRGCRDYAAGTALGIESITMRTRTFFVSHTFALDLDTPILVHAPATCSE